MATDVAARGLDITGVELVVQMEPPKDPENYIHRSGEFRRQTHQLKSSECLVLQPNGCPWRGYRETAAFHLLSFSLLLEQGVSQLATPFCGACW